MSERRFRLETTTLRSPADGASPGYLSRVEAEATLLVSVVDVHSMHAPERTGARYHDVSICRDSRSAADPPDADVRRGTETIRELRAVMLDVTDVHQLMLQLRHAVPTETALRAVEIERVHCIIDDAIAEGTYSSTCACVYGSPSIPSSGPRCCAHR